MRYISLTILLFAFWLALSGHYTPFLIGIGAVCSILCAVACGRMAIVDAETPPIHLFGRALTYFPWLVWEIVKSAWGVTRIIIDPKLPISPTMTVVKASQRTSVGIAAYADSITLTPGTITTGVKGQRADRACDRARRCARSRSWRHGRARDAI